MRKTNTIRLCSFQFLHSESTYVEVRMKNLDIKTYSSWTGSTLATWPSESERSRIMKKEIEQNTPHMINKLLTIKAIDVIWLTKERLLIKC